MPGTRKKVKKSGVLYPSGCAPKRAMVLAAGRGLRLRPITKLLPKALVKVAERTLIDWILDRLEDQGVKTVTVNLHYLGHLIEQHLGSRPSPDLRFSPEDKLLDTGGGVKKALGTLGRGPFFAINADALWLNGRESALGRMATAWDDATMDALLLLHFTVDAYGYRGLGDFCVEADGRLSRRPEGEVTPYLFAGVQILHPRLFEGVAEDAFSLNVLYDRVIEAGRLYGIVHDGEWFHIGTPDGLAEAEAFMRARYPGIKHR